jgi:hypothetical protein
MTARSVPPPTVVVGKSWPPAFPLPVLTLIDYERLRKSNAPIFLSKKDSQLISANAVLSSFPLSHCSTTMNLSTRMGKGV